MSTRIVESVGILAKEQKPESRIEPDTDSWILDYVKSVTK
jgi:hypothetical protein